MKCTIRDQADTVLTRFVSTTFCLLKLKKVKPTHREKNISAMMPSHNVWVTNEWANCGALSKFTVLINSDAGPSPWLAFSKVQLMFVLCAAIQEIR